MAKKVAKQTKGPQDLHIDFCGRKYLVKVFPSGVIPRELGKPVRKSKVPGPGDGDVLVATWDKCSSVEWEIMIPRIADNIRKSREITSYVFEVTDPLRSRGGNITDTIG